MLRDVRRYAVVFVAVGLVTAGCSKEQERAAERGAAAPRTDSTASSANGRLVPHTATLEQAAVVARDPNTVALPDDEHLATAIKLGYQIVRDPQTHAAAYAGNALSCTNCHPNGGQRELGMPWVGVAATFPQYRGRDARLISLEDRIADCFERSLNGKRPPYDSPEMMAISAYITWLSEGQPQGQSPAWRGKNKIEKDKQIPIEKLDVARGEQVFRQNCTACHGPDGQGVNLGSVKPGPLWGPKSWNDGAGAARIYTLAGFIRYAMPLTAPGSLSDEDAQHVAAFINSHDRPSFARKASDYPGGDVPIDAVYYPQKYRTNPLRR